MSNVGAREVYVVLYTMGVFRYTLPVLAVLKNCSAISTQCAATASSSINDVINGSHIATAVTAAPEVKQLQCNMASCNKIELHYNYCKVVPKYKIIMLLTVPK